MKIESFAQIPLRELYVIHDIAELAVEVYRDEDNVRERAKRNTSEVSLLTEVFFDLASCHAFCCPLRLCQLRDAPASYFVHDILGIRRNLDPKARVLKNGWMPRYAAALEAAA